MGVSVQSSELLSKSLNESYKHKMGAILQIHLRNYLPCEITYGWSSNKYNNQ